MNNDLRALALPALGTVAALVVEHVALWGDGERGWLWRRYGRLGAYTLGHGTIAVGFTVWALQTGHGPAARALWLLSAAGGLVVGVCWVSRAPALALRTIHTWGRAYLHLLDLAQQGSDPGAFGPPLGSDVQ